MQCAWKTAFSYMDLSIDTDSLSRLGDQGGIAREGKDALGPPLNLKDCDLIGICFS